MNNVKISVVITVYNLEKYIGECLDSVIGQDFDDMEILCVNDASSDMSSKISHEYASRDGRIRVFDLEHGVGPASARNVGYREAVGEYVYQMDGDDLLVPGALNRLYSCAKENDLDILTFSASAFTDDAVYEKNVRNSVRTYKRNGVYDGIVSGVELMGMFIKEDDFMGNLCCNFVNGDFLRKNSIRMLEGLRFSADNPFEMYLKAKRAMCIPDVLYRRRYRSGSIVTSPLKLIKFESVLCEFVYEFNLWQHTTLPDSIDKYIAIYFKNLWRYVLKSFDRVVNKNDELQLLPKYKGALLAYDLFFSNKNAYWSNAYWKPQLENEIRKIKKYKNIIVYGAAYIAKETIEILESHDIKNFAIAVTNNDGEKELNGRKVHNIDDITNMAEDSIVLIAVSKRNWTAVEQKLADDGFKNLLYIE